MISSETRKVGPFTGNDVTTVFPFSFKVFEASDLLVVRAVTATGVETTLTLTSDYTVALNADQDSAPGGSVTLLSALATGTMLVISSDVPVLQETQLSNLGGFYPEVINEALDKCAIIDQQQQVEIDRSLKFPISDAAMSTDLPIASVRKGKVLGFDAITGALTVTEATGAEGPQGPPGPSGGSGYVNTVSDASVPAGNSSGSGASANAALATAISANAGKTLMVPSGSVHHITADLTITNPLDVGGTGGFYVDSGKTLTLKGGRFPFAQCFWGPGTVKVVGVPYILSQWYGATGDGTTDDGPAIQRALDQNPSSTIYLIPTQFSSTGSTPISYKSNQRLQLNGQGQELRGQMIAKYLGGTKLRFAAGIGGVLNPSTYPNQKVKYLFVEGSDAAVNTGSSTWENYNSLSAITNLSTSGIEMAGGSPTVQGCRVSSFKGHGIEIYGASGGQPDMWKVENCYLDFNRAFGLFVTGVDANVGQASHVNLEGNTLGGLYDFAFYGNTYINIHTSQNARNGFSAGPSKTIAAASGIVVSAGVATVNAVAHGMTVGQWATSAGSDDATFNETAKILSVPDADHLTYATAHADGTTQNGTIATSSALQVLAYYNAKGIATGPFSTHSTAGGTVLITPYAEANQTDSVYNPNTITINGQGAWRTNVTTGHHMYGSSGPEWTFRGGHWAFVPLVAGDLLLVRDITNVTNVFTVDTSGNTTSLGTKLNLGASPSGNSNAINMSNTWGIYAKTTGGSNSRGVYFHSDDVWYYGDSTRALHLQGTTSIVDGVLQATKIKSGTSGNTDACGTITITAATTGTYTFAGTYATAPIVTVTPTSDPTAVGVYWVTVTTTTITITVKTSGTISFNYTCIART